MLTLAFGEASTAAQIPFLQVLFLFNENQTLMSLFKFTSKTSMCGLISPELFHGRILYKV